MKVAVIVSYARIDKRTRTLTAAIQATMEEETATGLVVAGSGVALAGDGGAMFSFILLFHRLTTGEGSNWGKIRARRVAFCAVTSAGDCMPAWPGRDRRVEQSGGEDAVSWWHGDGR